MPIDRQVPDRRMIGPSRQVKLAPPPTDDKPAGGRTDRPTKTGLKVRCEHGTRIALKGINISYAERASLDIKVTVPPRVELYQLRPEYCPGA
jgi:hypothetical protein